jgi:hypothetical protein
MDTNPNSPRLISGGIVLMDPTTSQILRIIALQYNPDTVTRSFQIKSVGETADRSEALRLKGPAVETIKVDVEIDAVDQLEISDSTTIQSGIAPQLAALETIVYPSSSQLQLNNTLEQIGTLEIIPMETPLVLFIWSKNRVVAVRITELGITEDAFDPNLNPIRAKVSLSMRVLTMDDLGFAHKGSSIFMAYLMQKEQLARKPPPRTLSTLGVKQIP